ncbi:VOC family protein [Bauldia litoralis]|uniref:VOC family protein n=1 Tax=Bauldia litoralis TaxID=665467 RepID=UPI0032677043
MSTVRKTIPDRPELNGVLETCLYCDDVAVTRAFYERVFGFESMVVEDRIIAMDAGQGHVLILFRRGGTLTPVPVAGSFIPPHDGGGQQHFAFGIRGDAYDAWKQYLISEGVGIESEVDWPQGGKSLYFRDPDGHLGELATPGLWSNY